MGQVAMAYPSKLVTRQVTPSPDVQQTATGPAPVANNYGKALTPEGFTEALNQVRQSGQMSFAGMFNGGNKPLITAQLRKNGYNV